jgi:hypothetical protein
MTLSQSSPSQERLREQPLISEALVFAALCYYSVLHGFSPRRSRRGAAGYIATPVFFFALIHGFSDFNGFYDLNDYPFQN